jgi:hypothetical protein
MWFSLRSSIGLERQVVVVVLWVVVRWVVVRWVVVRIPKRDNGAGRTLHGLGWCWMWTCTAAPACHGNAGSRDDQFSELAG